ncbi:CbiP [Desulforapulum autotrophicum HRM2]|uniref:CbiP n=1 Tax=Desulforapulum autotrophicum (strain ATCC 43914 / DSM 3382 / VKM B-1955 / HRM2) TaxID=177437 RepID=C0QES2_DESAH|nr:DUF4198 domain-containing protein [Desulforapulum autotrophicum]ACN15414.1 CbiP [Desulforapulum autotrophicum HRM2]
MGSFFAKLAGFKKIELLTSFCLLAMAGSAFAHFGMVIPSDSMVMQGEDKSVTLDLSFSHPFELNGMTLVKPASFFVVKDGQKEDLLPTLMPAKVMDHEAFTASYNIKRPGAYVFCMIPEPYWEPSEDCFIVHYTKTVVAAFGGEDGWDEPVGLKTEIVPMSKPYGLYGGNLFQGVVLLDGKIVPHAEVEVEYYNRTGKAKAPSDYMVTQTIKADSNGVFAYSVPADGWWGFAALNTSDKKKVHNGEKKDIELGAVLWVEFQKWQAGE